MLQQACVPHYRQRLFEALSSDTRFHFVVLADPSADVPFLRLSGETNGFEWEPAKQYNMRLPFGLSLSWQPWVIAKVLRERPDVVIAQGSPYDLTAWMLTVIGRVFGIPVLLWTHGLQGDERGFKWLVRKGLYRLAKGLLLYGDHAKRLLIEKGLGAERLHVVYNSLDDLTQKAVLRRIAAQDRDAFRVALGVGTNERLICFVGRLQPVKRLPWLLQAVALVKQRGKSVHLVLAGDGSERPLLEGLSRELQLDGLVHFLGELYEESRLGLAISSSDLAVVPSGAGLTVMHALAYGTPVLLHDKVEEHFPEWEAVQEGQTGWFYRYGDLSDCADKMIDALFVRPRKDQMAPACQAVINGRYNTATQARLFLETVARYCPLATSDGTRVPTHPDSILSSGSMVQPREERRQSC
jgi:glycosyltransferase involved in cell wall biosynthesis